MVLCPHQDGTSRTMGERVSINTERYQLLQEPGMRPPSLRLTYASSAFQNHVVACFGGILPWLRFNEEGLPFFEHRDETGRETCIRAAKVTNIAEIPRSELVRLLEGWLQLQIVAHHPELAAAEAAMMAGFLLPDPAIDLRNYRLYDAAAPKAGKLLHILWGFTTRTSPRSAVPAEFALAKLFGVEVEELAALAKSECRAELYREWEMALGYPPSV